MKKWLGLLSFVFLSSLPAAYAELFEPQEDRSYLVKYNLAVAAGTISTTSVVIDLSNTTAWPHKATGQIEISSIRLDLDKVAAATTTVRLGVITAVNTSSGSVTWFYTRTYRLNVSNTDLSTPSKGTDILYRCRVNPVVNSVGTTPYILSNSKIALSDSASTTFQTDVNLPNPTTVNTAPGVGDIVAQVLKDGTNAEDVNLEIHYFTRNR